MSIDKHIILDPVYLDFKSIPLDDYRGQVRYFEQYSKKLSTIDYSLWMETKLTYVYALFEIGQYHKLLHLVDRLIEEVVEENIENFKNEDPFEALLYRKAASLFNTQAYKKTGHLLFQLIRINPKENLYRILYRKAALSQPNPRYLRYRSISLLLLIMVVPVLVIELLVINTLFPDYEDMFTWFRIGLVLAGLTLFLSLEYIKIRNVERQIKVATMSKNKTKKDS